MSFTPRYQSIFEGLVMDNILAIIKRDMKSALDYYYASENLPDLAQRTLGDFISLEFPALAIEANKNSDQTGEEYESRRLSLVLGLAVTDADPTEVTRKLMKYVRALASVLRTASSADYLQSAMSTVMPITKEISWQYLQLGKETNPKEGTPPLYLRPANFDLVLTYSER